MDKSLFVFLVPISLILVLGCIFPSGPSTTVDTATGEFSKGTFGGVLLVNGQGTETVSLLSEQSAQIGLRLRNVGSGEVENINALLVGCLEGQAVRSSTEQLLGGSEDVFSWSVQAPPLSSGEVISCPVFIRVCYDKVSRGTTELRFVPEGYTDIIEPASQFSDSDVLGINFNFGAIRVLSSGRNEVSGAITITNIGAGFVDYTAYPAGSNLAINTLRGVTMNLTAPGVEIVRIRDVTQDKLPLSSDARTLELTASGASIDTLSLLRLIQGREDFLQVRLNVTDPERYQEGPMTETLDVEVDHGYCIDVATLQATLRGR
jgi:hypothetical protein